MSGVPVDSLPFPMQMRIGANLYQQSSAEFHAACQTIYQSAQRRMDEIVRAKGNGSTNLAVILDLDETVIDNGVFQTFLYQNSLEYTDDLWGIYEGEYGHETTLMPGAKAFIEHAVKLGVTPVYLSNRSQRFQDSTIATLKRLGLDPEPVGKRLFLKDPKLNSDKTARREAVAAQFDVVMIIGDNLRDFSEAYAAPKLKEPTDEVLTKAITQRAAQVDADRKHWGIDWFMLPNPVYGEWEKLVGREPLKRLRPTTIVAPTR